MVCLILGDAYEPWIAQFSSLRACCLSDWVSLPSLCLLGIKAFSNNKCKNHPKRKCLLISRSFFCSIWLETIKGLQILSRSRLQLIYLCMNLWVIQAFLIYINVEPRNNADWLSTDPKRVFAFLIWTNSSGYNLFLMLCLTFTIMFTKLIVKLTVIPKDYLRL
ncbi:unnamed protein product [Blepharisma stoltei]|uniref:Uncharacterized protein n=1 Tax=Blepharisma stoltei TaxID=1481888 RepID=A0AAU9J4M7_9CILI|nr:unnamed protein product [Blepharisma stoltei]